MNPINLSLLQDVMKSPQVANSVTVIEECFQKFQLNEIFVCFNGGKDCTVLLFLVLNVIRRLNSEFSGKLTCMYARTNEPFVEVENFIENCRHIYNLNITIYSGGIKESLRQMLDNNSGLKACLAGTKRTDPFSENLNYFQNTDADWPSVIRVSPLLDWSYNQIWDFLLQFNIPYCDLYDKGYTSLGSQDNTIPNPLLRISNSDQYLPAYKLDDGKEERAGRIVRKF